VEILEVYLVRIIAEPRAAQPGDTVPFAADHKLMEVEIGPAQGDLQRVVEVGDGAVTTHQQPPPDQWADLTQIHAQLIDGNLTFGSGHRQAALSRDEPSFLRRSQKAQLPALQSR